jgi:hypothetical protein
MMDEEKLNNDLRSRISEVFENYEDTTADAGWDLLRQKYPPKEKDRGLAWLWYAAAAVVLLCLGIWFIQKPGKPNQLMVKQSQPIIQHHPVKNQADAISADTLQRAGVQNNAANHIAQNNVTKTVPAPGKVGSNTSGAIPSNSFNAASIAAKQATIQSGKVSPVQNNVSNTQSVVAYQPLATAPLATNRKNAALPGIDTNGKQVIITNTGNSIAKNKPANTERPNTKPPDSTAKAAAIYARNQTPSSPSKTANEKAFNSLFEGKNAPAMKDEPTLKGSKKTMFSVYAATYFNYDKGSDNQMNVGAGFTSDFKISKNLRLSTGLAVGQNSLSYNTSPAPSSSSLSFASAPAGASTSFATDNLVSVSKVNIPKRYNASLVGLDIPVNLKYQFTPQNDTYVAAGLSSGTFINETYQSISTNASNTVESVESTTHNSFSNFNFARTLNFSFGVGYPLGKSNRLIVEPFLKYPLDGLGSQQLKFGAGGVNLKLNFQSSKK